MTHPDSVCVCGHPKEEHFDGSGCAHENRHQLCDLKDMDRVTFCGCMEFRECLPWPDSEGWWWCRSEVLDTLCYARLAEDEEFLRQIAPHATIGEFVILVSGLHGREDDWETEKMFNREFGYGPARFKKLLEPNPFEPQP